MSVLAWHFTAERFLSNSDGIPIVEGEWFEVAPPISLCKRGLHGSKRIIDALSYASGSLIWLTEHDGEILRGDDKLCSTRRRAMWGIDGSDEGSGLLRRFARICALVAAPRWAPSGAVMRWLALGDPAARDAARDAAWDAARDAAWDAARAAAWAARWTVAQNAKNNLLTRWVEHVHAHGPLPREILPRELDEPARTLVRRVWDEEGMTVPEEVIP